MHKGYMRGMATVALLAIWSLTLADGLNSKLDISSVVCVAMLRQVRPGFVGITWQKGHETSSRSFPVALLDLDVLQEVKGNGAKSVTIAVPADLISPEPRRGKLYNGRVGTVALWFLQAKNREGTFDAGSTGSTLTFTYEWSTKSAELSPLYPFTAGSFYDVKRPGGKPGGEPWVRLLDIFGTNAIWDRSESPYYFSLMLEMLPQERWVGGSEAEPNHTIRQQFATYLDGVLAPTFGKGTPKDRLNLSALRLWAGEHDVTRTFMQLYQLKPEELQLPFPPLDRATDRLAALKATANPGIARALFIGLSDSPELRPELLSEGIRRLGQDRLLDAGILEMGAKLLNRPDLIPVTDGRLDAGKEKVALFIRLAKQSLGSP